MHIMVYRYVNFCMSFNINRGQLSFCIFAARYNKEEEDRVLETNSSLRQKKTETVIPGPQYIVMGREVLRRNPKKICT